MAIIKDGSISGKLGNLVAYKRNGEEYLRKAPERTAPPTEKELVNQFIFRLVQEWVNPINAFLKLGFRGYSKKNYGANACKSLIYANALVRDGYHSYIDSSKVPVSAGAIPLPASLGAQLMEERQLEFFWDREGNGDAGDRVMMLAYNVEAKTAAFEIGGARRSAGRDLLGLEHVPAGTYHLYGAFLSMDGSGQSDSRYLGNVGVV